MKNGVGGTGVGRLGGGATGAGGGDGTGEFAEQIVARFAIADYFEVVAGAVTEKRPWNPTRENIASSSSSSERKPGVVG